MLPEINRNITKHEKIIDVFGGFNNTENARENEFSNIVNMGHDKYPSITTRPPRTLISNIAIPNGAISFNGSLYLVNGTSFTKDGVSKGTVTNGRKCLIEFNKNILIFPDMKYYDTVGNVFGSFANGTINPIPNPAILKATVHNNRVFGINGANIYASKQGDFKEWNVFDQLNTDSWATDVAGAVEFKTIGTYQNHVVMQSAVNMFELYGYMPSNFQIQETAKIGSIVDSYVEMESVLYFVNTDGIYAYAGGVPRKISQTINMAFASAVMGAFGGKLYISAVEGTTPHLFVFDSTTKLVTRYDEFRFTDFIIHGGFLTGVCSDTGIYKFDFGTDYNAIHWCLETIEFKEDQFTRRVIKNIELNAEMGVGSQINVYIKGDNDVDYKLIKTFNAETDRILLLPITIGRNHFKIQIDGYGYVKLNSLKKTTIRGGSLNAPIGITPTSLLDNGIWDDTLLWMDSSFWVD